jgi:hypothetical protein
MTHIAVIHQPDFVPHLGFFQRLLYADTFVLLDTAQYVNATSRSWTNRDRIKGPQGERWLTISVKSAPRETPINKIEISDTVNWRARHLNQLRECYRKSAYFDEIFSHVECLYAKHSVLLVDFTIASIKMLMDLFDIHIDLVLASSLQARGSSNELLVAILREIGASAYLSGLGARDYFRPEPFAHAGIEVRWQDFVHPEYPQLHGPFISYLSSIDLLFNCGVARSREILRSC